MSDFMHEDPRPLDQRTPPPTPPPQQGGEPAEPGAQGGEPAEPEAQKGEPPEPGAEGERGEGADPKAKRALTISEFSKQLELLRSLGAEKQDYNFLVKYPAMSLWQYNLIARIEDVVYFGMANPMGHTQYPFAIKTKFNGQRT